MEIKFITDETKKARDFFLEKISFMIIPEGKHPYY